MAGHDPRHTVDRARAIRWVLVDHALGVQFVVWVRYFESGGTTLRVERPDGVEAWLRLRAAVLVSHVRVEHDHVAEERCVDGQQHERDPHQAVVQDDQGTV